MFRMHVSFNGMYASSRSAYSFIATSKRWPLGTCANNVGCLIRAKFSAKTITSPLHAIAGKILSKASLTEYVGLKVNIMT